MKTKIKSSARANRRYLLIRGRKEDVELAVTEGTGSIGWAKAAPVFLDAKEGWTILCVDRKEVDNIRAAIELFGKAEIKRVSGTIRPVRSAIGIKSSGMTTPRSGCCQRLRASTPETEPSRITIFG